MNDYISAIINIIYIILSIALIDKLIELFKNIKKITAPSCKISGYF